MQCRKRFGSRAFQHNQLIFIYFSRSIGRWSQRIPARFHLIEATSIMDMAVLRRNSR